MLHMITDSSSIVEAQPLHNKNQPDIEYESSGVGGFLPACPIRS